MYEEQLRSLGFFQPRAEQAEGRPHDSLQLPLEGSGGAGTELRSLGTVTGPEGMAWSCVRLGVRKRFFTKRVVGHCNRLPRAVIMALSLLEFKKHLDKAPRHMF